MKKEKNTYKAKINWHKELRLLPGYIVVFLWLAFTVVMLGWIIGASLSTPRDIYQGNIFSFSTGLHWENYITAWKAQNVSVFFGNSLLYSVVSCVGVLAIAAPAAYVLSRWKFRGGKALRIGLVIAMSVPVIMVIMPIYSLSVQWGIKGRVLLSSCTSCSGCPTPPSICWISSPPCPGPMRRPLIWTGAALPRPS